MSCRIRFFHEGRAEDPQLVLVADIDAGVHKVGDQQLHLSGQHSNLPYVHSVLTKITKPLCMEDP